MKMPALIYIYIYKEDLLRNAFAYFKLRVRSSHMGYY